MSDLIKKWDEERKAKILRMGETFSEAYIYCPYCAYEQQDIWEWDLTANDEETEEQCQSCERHFMYSCRQVYSTRRLK